MLIFQILALFAITVASSHLMARQEPTPPPLSAADPCSQNCTSTYNLIVQCALSPDPSCGCSQFRTDSASCSQCLQSTNSTVAGFLTYDYIRSSIAGCSCEIPACATIGSVVRFCLYADPKSVACSCPAFLATGSQCSQCLRGVDPYVADLYDTQYIPGCQLFQSYIANLTGVSATNCPVVPNPSSGLSSASSSKPSSVPASGSAVSSPSGVVTFTSASDKLHLSTPLALVVLGTIIIVQLSIV